ELLEQVLDEFPEDHGALNDLGYLWADRGVHLPQALKMIRRAVEAEPDNPAYRDSLGWVWYRLGQPERARAELQRAAELLDDEPDGVILEHLGDVYHALGQAAEARAAWQQALAAFAEEEDRAAGERVRGKLQPR
nr:tetratricopeptide repeat protein [Planctomycetales bacterium]